MTGTSPIGAVIAMEVELQHLLAQGHIKQESKHGPWREVRLQIGEHEVMAVLCGIGMVNAAAATEYLIGAHRPRIIVNSGCTGAHVAELLPGDVVIGTSVIYHAAMQILLQWRRALHRIFVRNDHRRHQSPGAADRSRTGRYRPARRRNDAHP